MSTHRLHIRYPLEALHKREGWRLEALQAELGATSRRLLDSNARCGALRRDFSTVVSAGAPLAASAIDPVLSRSRLLYLSDLHTQIKAAAQAVVDLEASRDRLRLRSGEQRAALEAIERHRREFVREERVRVERLQSVEADRDWLAGSRWRDRADGSAPDDGVAGDDGVSDRALA